MSDRFEELLAQLLDEELTELELVELSDFVRHDPTKLEELRAQLEAEEMLVLAEDELHTPDRFLWGLRAADEAVPAGFAPVVEVSQATSIHSWWITPLAVAAILALAFVLWPLAAPARSIATIQSVHGDVQWTGDGGKIHEARLGEQIGGGTIESLSADAWAVVEFPDATTVTMLGRSALTVTEDQKGQKILRLNDGVMTADVQPQPEGRPMVVRTLTAEIEVVGTQFNLDAESSKTTLAVNKGLVRLRRLTDGEVVDVPANHQTVASVDEQNDMQVTIRGAAANLWQSDLAREVTHGKWSSDLSALGAKLKEALRSGELTKKEAASKYKAAANLDADGGLLFATPWLKTHLKSGTNTDVSYLAALSVTRGQSVPVVADTHSRFRIAGQLDASTNVKFGITTLTPDGRFSGKYFVVRSIDVSEGGGDFDIEVPLAEFKPVDSKKVTKSPSGQELVDWWCITKGNDVKLAIRRVELLPAIPLAAPTGR